MKNEKTASVRLGMQVSPFLEPVGCVLPPGTGLWLRSMGIQTYGCLPPVEVDDEEDPMPAVMEQPIGDVL